jgi:hypothetical protein
MHPDERLSLLLEEDGAVMTEQRSHIHRGVRGQVVGDTTDCRARDNVRRVKVDFPDGGFYFGPWEALDDAR